MAAAPEIVAVPAFSDNYIWLLHDSATGHTAVVDPGDGAAALAAAEARGWRISQVLITHWHPDHTGGIAAVVAATGAPVWGPEAERDKFAGLDHGLSDGDRVEVGPWTAEVWHVPGHTLGHIAFILPDAGLAFTGDTLFAGGCGRLFEGSPEQMFTSLERLASLPDETVVHPAHEYTLSNYRFAAHAFPGDAAIAGRLAEVQRLRAAGAMTLPTTIAVERATNPFLRAPDAAEFASLRQGKDSFR
ncbi:hydroxyacylglutathione hydrolase [Sphingomonas sp. BN140010]|uniref:Hydroxyacylglutathione hydrolase n=2 Tax=Sphingomonas arvum TaxID=2992113 RepID=A0ABT3JFP5_9SPHN|nr:hydroxyacylglutathione hydrolase [Sphingomonas sp. BN140010]MCW3797863.1 hydroxyacylglutathione hydrolase [Sphingomonas sp. BN140010]